MSWLIQVSDPPADTGLRGYVVVWNLAPDISLRHFWLRSIDPPDHTQPFQDETRPAKPIFVAAPWASSFGRYQQNKRLTPEVLLVMALGSANLARCRHCTLLRESTRVFGPGDHASGEAVQMAHPFPFCVSLPGTAGGRCGNCLYHGHGQCEYADVDFCPDDLVRWLRARHGGALPCVDPKVPRLQLRDRANSVFAELFLPHLKTLDQPAREARARRLGKLLSIDIVPFFSDLGL
jgi:hypothetical protein